MNRFSDEENIYMLKVRSESIDKFIFQFDITLSVSLVKVNQAITYWYFYLLIL